MAVVEVAGQAAHARQEGADLGPAGPRVVVCGSFRRGTRLLREDFDALARAGCGVLSPRDVEFVQEIDGFVLAAHEVGEDPHRVQARHLEALQQADFVWLHAPEGYVGTSAALEVGVAHSLGIPVYCRSAPSDLTLSGFVTVVAAPEAAAELARGAGNHTPARPLQTLQTYYERVAVSRGFDRESAQDTLLLLTEEVGELARSIRKSIGLARAASVDIDPAAELADVQLYVLHLANVIGVDLAEAVAAKERINHERYAAAA